AALENGELYSIEAGLLKPEDKLKSYDGLYTDEYVKELSRLSSPRGRGTCTHRLRVDAGSGDQAELKGLWVPACAGTPAKGCALRLVHDRAAQRADAGDLDLEHVAGLHPERRIAAVAHALGRAGCNDITRRQRREVLGESGGLRGRVDQEIGGGALPLRPVVPCHQR